MRRHFVRYRPGDELRTCAAAPLPSPATAHTPAAGLKRPRSPNPVGAAAATVASVAAPATGVAAYAPARLSAVGAAAAAAAPAPAAVAAPAAASGGLQPSVEPCCADCCCDFATACALGKDDCLGACVNCPGNPERMLARFEGMPPPPCTSEDGCILDRALSEGIHGIGFVEVVLRKVTRGADCTRCFGIEALTAYLRYMRNALLCRKRNWLLEHEASMALAAFRMQVWRESGLRDNPEMNPAEAVLLRWGDWAMRRSFNLGSYRAEPGYLGSELDAFWTRMGIATDRL